MKQTEENRITKSIIKRKAKLKESKIKRKR